jgi:hypothetical protein
VRLAAAALFLLVALAPDVSSAVDDVRITIPAAVTFDVTNVTLPTTGRPIADTVRFNSLSVPVGRVLNISVKADSDFVPPGGPAIPASKVSWTTSGATNGVGSNGVLSTSAFGQLFQSGATKKNGNVDVTWVLTAPGTNVQAGLHRLTIRWKLEAIIP